jgi:predicted amidohydrolase
VKYTIATAQYPIDRFDGLEAYVAKLTDWVATAAKGGAKLAVFPEYGGMELASLDPDSMGDLFSSMAFVAGLRDGVDGLHQKLAMEHDIHILAASLPSLQSDGSFVNSARLFSPSGKMGVQEKLVMTWFEREEWGVAAGWPLRLFDTALGKIGVLVCYDCEFPLLARALVEAGADVILVPSCTDTLAGYHRVRIGAQARALEGQCYTVQSATVGEALWSPAVDVNHGAAAIYSPPDQGFPDSGVIVQGELDQPQWVFGEVDLDLVAAVRVNGAVLNRKHWQEQPGAAELPKVELVSLA